MTPEVIDFLEEKLRLDWSPEQVPGWLAKQQGISISHECIYRNVWANKHQGGNLFQFLRHGNKKHREIATVPKMGAARSRTG